MKVALVGVVSFLAAGAALGFELVGPKGAATVVVRADAEASSRLAAEEFAAYVGKVTGRMPRIAVEGHGGETPPPQSARMTGIVRIGTLAKLPDAPAEAKAALAKSKSDESAWTGVRGNTLQAVPNLIRAKDGNWVMTAFGGVSVMRALEQLVGLGDDPDFAEPHPSVQLRDTARAPKFIAAIDKFFADNCTHR